MREQPARSTTRLPTTELRPSTERGRSDRVITEEPLEIRLTWSDAPSRRVWTTMRTPGDDFELAAGWIIHEGVAAPTGIRDVRWCAEPDLRPEQRENTVTVTLTGQPERLPEQLTHGSSACGVCGTDALADLVDLPGVADPVMLDDALVRGLPSVMAERQRLFDRTGAVHAAGLATLEGDLVAVREDVGRHNALDKLTGSRVLAGHQDRPLAAGIVVLSGRVGFEMVTKSVAGGAGAIVAVGAPTSLAVRAAQQTGLSLYGFTTHERTVRYT